MPDRRFRDMRLTEEEVETAARERWFHRCVGLSVPETTKAVTRYNKLLTKAKRLLPLWRKWGLEELWAKGYQDACKDYGGFE